MATKPNTTRKARPAAGGAARPKAGAPRPAPVIAVGPLLSEMITWTALPNGVVGTGPDARLKVSVFISPRLKQGGDGSADSLSKYPSFIDWPAVVKNIHFGVEFEGVQPIANVIKVSPDPESELWKALFKPAAPVKSFTIGDFHTRPVLSYPVSHVQTFLKEKYLSVAAEPQLVTELPLVRHLASDDMFGRIAFHPRPAHVAAAELRGVVPKDVSLQTRTDLHAALRARKYIPSRSAPDAQKDFTQFNMFHAPMVTERAKIKPPDLDFHRVLAALGKFPGLMRKLGLVVDLEIPWRPDIPAGPASTTVKVVPFWGDKKRAGDYVGRTKYVLGPGAFYAAARPDSDLKGRLLNLSDPGFDIVQLDVDAAATKALDFANNVAMSALPSAARKGERSGLPTLKSAGISVVKKERDRKVYSALQTTFNNNQKAVAMMQGGAPSGVIYYADDLLRGYRVDVWDSESKAWRSLCRRVGRYEFLDNGVNLQIEDEGFVSSAVTQSPVNGTHNDELRVHEALFRWAGWSLCAPRPGKTIMTDDKPGEIENVPGAEFRLKTSFAAVPGSLPKLRFGRAYRLRARAVDLAGNSAGHDEPDPDDFSTATDPITYTRFEPVSSPVTVLRQDPKAPAAPGDRPSGDKAVARTGALVASPGESVEHLVIRSFNDSPAKDKQTTKVTTDRHIAPPKTAQMMAETHGTFDAASGLKKEDYETITERDGVLKEVEPAEKLDLPYLPDPIALGAALAGLPGADSPEKIEFYPKTAWPEARPFRLKVVEGAGAPEWDENDRVLTVFLPKAEVSRFNLSCYLKEEKLQPMGVWHWLEQAAGAANVAPLERPKVRLPKLNFVSSSDARARAVNPLASMATPNARVTQQALTQLRTIALEGRNWLFTPSREITLVHAVQQPLRIPGLQIKGAKIAVGETHGTLNGSIAIHGKSTGKVNLVAEWQEPIDPISEKTWRKISGSAQVFERTPAREDSEVKYVRTRHNFGDTKYRKIRYSAVGTTRFREYFSPIITRDQANITRTSQAVEVDIPSSARPDAPRVVYVIPTFGWDTPRQQGQVVTRKRLGGGLRVYLERPWFSSGDGELLGVVLTDQGGVLRRVSAAVPDQASMPYVTQWGADPIWDSGSTHRVPLFEHFKNSAKTQDNLSLAEVKATEDPKGPKVAVVGYPVEYDEKRELWYADIEIDAGPSYFPFVCLALARYQPNSIDNAHLSRVVVTEFAQLAPDRTASITKTGTGQLRVQVSGVTYNAGGAGKGTSEVEVSVEERVEGTEGDLGWVPVKDAAFQLQHPTGLLKQNNSVWVGEVKLPDAAGGKLRLVIKEFEVFRAEQTGLSTVAMTVAPTAKRLVYADVLEI
ncbi:MAG: hypothetical protein Q7T82_03085 [Armatimonadota bacterium]|nr:hypothetical protein [Armatimonadota bacterium]